MQPNMPQLRFSEFANDGAWEEKKLGELAKPIRKKNKNSEVKKVLTNSALHGVIDQRDYFEKDIANQANIDGYFIIEKGDYVYNPRKSELAPVGPLSKNKIDRGVMSPLYTIFRFNSDENGFFEHYFKTIYWHRYLNKKSNDGARHDRMAISNNDFFNMPILCPSDIERQKIDDFIISLNDLLDLEQQKLDSLQEYKKGMMQQLFSQKIRFTDDNGNPYPDWQEKRLSDIGETYNGLTGKVSTDFKNGNNYYIQYKQVFDSPEINTSKFGLVHINDNEKQNKVNYGDIFFTTSSETPNEVGFSSVMLENIENVYLNSFCFGYRINQLNIVYPIFSKYLFRSLYVRSEIVKLAQGSTRYNISKIQLLRISISLPSYKEQQKIADYLTTLDNIITQQQQKIDSLKHHKKGMMQQLFPNPNPLNA